MKSAEQLLETLRKDSADCPRCDLAETRNRVVFGEGNPHARIVFVGQGPGEVEDRDGRPFVGPAGRLMDAMLAEAGLQRADVWLTNIVKCWPLKVENGRKKSRPPRVSEVRACRVWLDGEMEATTPKVIVCVGAPAAQGLLRKDFRMMEEHGRWEPGPNGTRAMGILHPAYLLRLRSVDEAAFRAARDQTVQELREAARVAAEDSNGPETD